MSKAYQVEDTGYRGEAVIVFAETAGKARAAGAAELDEEFVGVRVKRAPLFDGMTRDQLTPAAYLARGWWVWCSCCHQKMVFEDEAILSPDGEAYCSEWCRAKAEEKARE